jgi:diguanylate cyclase (GGDEF)-like protein
MGAKQYSPWERSAAAPQTTPIYSAFDVAFSTLERRSEWQLVLIALLMLGSVGLADYFTGAQLAFSIFYLAPVIFVGWFVSGRMGMLFAVLAAITWAYLDIVSGPHFSAFAHSWNTGVRFAFFVIVLLLIMYSKHAHDRERVTARTDSLTEVANARAFQERATLALASQRRSGQPITLAYIDLDRFKRINDTYGHSTGDEVLKAVAEAIAVRLRATDLVARLGGDEFAALLPDTDLAAARRVLEDVDDGVRRAVDGRWPVGLTVGAVTFTEPPVSIDDMVRRADDLMFQGKRAGRGSVRQASWPGGNEE